MMKRIFILSLGALSLLASCQQGDASADLRPVDEAIGFDAEVLTRGAIITQENIKDFGVYGYYTGTERWTVAGSSTVPNKLFNTQVSKQPDATWKYDTPVYWTDLDDNPVSLGHFFHFYAYAPYVGVDSKSQDITLNALATTTGAPTLTYTQASSINLQTDLLVAEPRPDMMHIGSRVSMRFGHALSRIGFSASIADAESNSTYQISAIRMVFKPDEGVVYRQGTIDLTTRKWSRLTEAAEDGYTLTIPVIANSNLADTPKNITPDNECVFFIPQEVSGGIHLTFTVNKKVNNTDTSKEFNVSLPPILWEAGKHYNYSYVVNYASTTMSLSGVTVDEWTTSSGGSFDIF